MSLRIQKVNNQMYITLIRFNILLLYIQIKLAGLDQPDEFKFRSHATI